jgi:uncharacterized membrane protein (UPF0136 family)
MSLISGVFFGACMTVSNYLQHPGSWTRAIVLGLIQGVFFGAVMGPLQSRQSRKILAAVGNMPAHDLRVARRAVMRGPVPVDPKIRWAAEWLATTQLKASSRLRWLGFILFAFATVGNVSFALTSSPWWWLGAAAMLIFCALCLLMPIHLRRRIQMLRLETSS